ncbi:hypothetical protein M0R19_05880 [Candidatus Pacearchaeota archaeon]|jgi:hypothetical protein|nr:hypothetical protein [Candidatus Pacearchaeota archaeon]
MEKYSEYFHSYLRSSPLISELEVIESFKRVYGRWDECSYKNFALCKNNKVTSGVSGKYAIVRETSLCEGYVNGYRSFFIAKLKWILIKATYGKYARINICEKCRKKIPILDMIQNNHIKWSRFVVFGYTGKVCKKCFEAEEKYGKYILREE